MTDHLDEAAAKAVDIANRLREAAVNGMTPLGWEACVDIANRLREAAVNGMTPLGWEACAHLAYMAGLLRRGAVIEAAHRAFPLRNVPGVADTNPTADEIPHDHLPWPVRQAVSAVLSACYEHADPKVREAREQLYNAVTHGQLTDPTLETVTDNVDPRAAARNFRASAAKLGGGSPYLDGVRHGYLMAADALDAFAGVYDELRKDYDLSVRQHEKTADAMDQARAQRDELLSAARDALSVVEDLVPGLVLDRLREAVERVEVGR